MKQFKIARAVLFTVPILFLAAFSATASAEEIALADAIDPAQSSAATGLDIVMDGSSLEAFEKSMEQVRETGSEMEYRGIKGAFDYLLIYDLGAQGNREKLAARLDGKTGREILGRVKWRSTK